VDADPRHQELFMMEAEDRARALSPDYFKPVFATIVIGGLLVACLAAMCSNHSPKVSTKQTQPTAIAKQNDITRTLEKVAEGMRRQVDVNNDGLNNCIDAAVLFYQYYPDKSKVCIERNYNPATGMNHLFNCVLVDGVWRAIEPQMVWRGHTSYWMKDIWGAQYDNQLNVDETEDWKVFAK